MAINPIQFQKGISLPDFIESYGTVEQCELALAQARWPNGFACPKCQCTKSYQFRRGNLPLWQCHGCSHQTSLIAGKMMEHSRLSLTKWYLAIYLITQSKTNIAALALRRQLGISWRAAWLLKHKIMQAMYEREVERPLNGDIRIDDAYLGGELTGGKAGRGSENKVPFVAAVEMLDGRPQRVRFDVVEAFSFAALKPWAKLAIAPESVVTSDGLKGFEVLSQVESEHKVVIAPKGKVGTEIDAFKWLNVLLGNLKTALSGTHHAFKFRRYGYRYLAEVQYRFNRRSDLASMIPRLAVALVRASPCSKKKILQGLR